MKSVGLFQTSSCRISCLIDERAFLMTDENVTLSHPAPSSLTLMAAAIAVEAAAKGSVSVWVTMFRFQNLNQFQPPLFASSADGQSLQMKFSIFCRSVRCSQQVYPCLHLGYMLNS